MRIVGGSLVHRLGVVVRVVVDRGHAVVNGLHCTVYTICSEAKFLVLGGQVQQPYAIFDYIPQSGTRNLAPGRY